MDPATYQFQSEFPLRYISLGNGEGRAEGKAEGKAEVVLRQLALPFGTLEQQLIERVRSASLDELDNFAERVLTAQTLEDVLR